jgi:hypothetical protein
MAILAAGEVLREGVPDELVRELEGQVWGKTVAKAELPAIAARGTLLSASLHSGRTRARVHAHVRPDAGFEPVQPDLEDVYFHTLAQQGVTAAREM